MMNVMNRDWDDPQEPVWPDVALITTDFRRLFPGDLINIFTLIYPEATTSETLEVLEHHTRAIAKWIISHRNRFASGDRFQIVVGWPESIRETGRQMIKMGGGFDAVESIADGSATVTPRSGWTKKIFESESQNQ